MGGISTGVGIFSGIDTGQLITQLLSANSGPKRLAERRLVQLQTQQAAYLDLNSALSALRSAASSFRTAKTFDSKTATSNNEIVLTATAGANAQNGSYKFVVDRLVSTRQLLSRGFADTDRSSIGLTNISVEDSRARLDRDTALSDLNDGAGITRGVITINGEEIDLTRAATVSDVLDAINSTPGLDVTASVSEGTFVLTGTGAITIANGAGYTTADSLGIAGTQSDTFTGSTVYGININTPLATLNDGRGIHTDPTVDTSDAALGDPPTVTDLNIDVGGTTVKIRLGERFTSVDDGEGGTKLETFAGAVSTVGGALDRINDELAAQGFAEVTVSVDPATGSLSIDDTSGRVVTVSNGSGSTTADDLGLAGTYAGGSGTGDRVLAGLNSTLASGLNGGTGIGGDGILFFDVANGDSFNITGLTAATTLDELTDLINADGRVTASINDAGTGLRIVDNTRDASNTADLVISGTGLPTSDTAVTLGLDGTYTNGIARGSNLQLSWVGNGTRLADLNNGKGIGTGSFRITDSLGSNTTIEISADMTIRDLIDELNGSTVSITASLNATGDGVLITDTGGGSVKLNIEDVNGTTARELGLLGTATDSGADNFIDGSFETQIEFGAGATLEDIVKEINSAGVQVAASIINDGTGATPNRLSLAGRDPGTDGRFVLDTQGFDLGINVLDQGEDARVFFGSTNPATGVLISSSSDTLDGVLSGVTINLTSTSQDPVELSITTDIETIEEQIGSFLESYNNVLDRIDNATRYVEETKERGVLLGDGTANQLKQRMFRAAIAQNTGFSEAFNSLSAVGVTIGEGGRLEFDRDDFRAALEEDPDAVERLFTTRDIDADAASQEILPGITASNPDADTEFSALGVVAQIEQFANGYINSIDGVLTLRGKSLDSQIALQQSRIEQFDIRLESQRQVLSRQFLAMEQSIAQIQTQSQSLGQIALVG
ncbi:MAG: flagellar hook-associated protein 2 [Phycisphaeraceae bacterium]|nr:MAG: flagellar hook-associated protein 2 [Phycisphaeraceae bacterium]